MLYQIVIYGTITLQWKIIIVTLEKHSNGRCQEPG